MQEKNKFNPIDGDPNYYYRIWFKKGKTLKRLVYIKAVAGTKDEGYFRENAIKIGECMSKDSVADGGTYEFVKVEHCKRTILFSEYKPGEVTKATCLLCGHTYIYR